jgi:hypothetical protein
MKHILNEVVQASIAEVTTMMQKYLVCNIVYNAIITQT